MTAIAVPATVSSGDPLVEILDLSVLLGGQLILNSLSLSIAKERTLVILGESGCGKTTLLRALTGLIPISSGAILIDGESAADLPPSARRMIYLDQEPLLFEHLTIAENIAFAMRLRKRSPAEIDSAVRSMLQEIDLTEHASKREWEISGGQKQRVAFARAILGRPRLLLLDEPFSSLDSRTRRQMQTFLARICRQHRLTSIFVTHDVKEALIVGDSFARMVDHQLILYPDREAFMKDRSTGVFDEIEFWQETAAQLRRTDESAIPRTEDEIEP